MRLRLATLLEACHLLGEYALKVLKIPARSRNLFRFPSVFALSLRECSKEGNDAPKQRRLGLELIANSFRLHVVAPLKIGYVGGEGCNLVQKLFYISAYSGQMLRHGNKCALQLVVFGGEDGDCAFLLLNQGLRDLEIVPNGIELLGLVVALHPEFRYLAFRCPEFLYQGDSV
jgi:hypothetical protein